MPPPLAGLAYVALFGLGLMVGMAVLPLAISIPPRSKHRFAPLHTAAQAVVGFTKMAVGPTLFHSKLLSVAQSRWQHLVTPPSLPSWRDR
jgi:hypothetical protein